MKRIRVKAPVAAQILAIVLVGAFIGLMALFVVQGYRLSVERGQQKAVISASVIATQFQWIVEASRQALRRIDETLGYRPYLLTGAELHDITETIGALPGSVDARVFDPEGREVLSESPAAGRLEIADRGYFQVLKNGRDFVISRQLTDRVTGQPSIIIASRLERGDRFAGIAAIVVPSRLVSDLCATLDLGSGSIMAIVRMDGWIVANQPPVGETFKIRDDALLHDYLAVMDSGSYRTDTIGRDGVDRLVGFFRVRDTEVVAVAAISVATATADFRDRVWRGRIAAIPILTGLIGFAWWVSRLLAADERRRVDLEQALEQNRLLLREIHHRVKNNLQTVSSLVRLQQIAPDARRDLTARIAAMAAVHEQIYNTDRFGDIALDAYLKSIAENVRSGFDGEASLELSLAPILLDSERAMVLGLIVTELVSNSLKYGFPERRPGVIRIALSRSDDTVILAISDNGVGFDSSIASKGIGIRLIKSLVRQLDGDSSMSGDGGLQFRLEFSAHAPGNAPTNTPTLAWHGPEG